MSRIKTFWIVSGFLFVLFASLFWQGTEAALFGLLAGVLEGNGAGLEYFVGWFVGTAIPAFFLGWVASLVAHVVRKRANPTLSDESVAGSSEENSGGETPQHHADRKGDGSLLHR